MAGRPEGAHSVGTAGESAAGGPVAAPDWRGLIAPVLAGLAARLLLIAWTTPLELSHDEARFWDLAGNRMQGTAFLPPLYPFLLVGLRALAGDDLVVVRILSAVLSLGVVVLAGRLAERHLGPGEGRIPAWIAALMPSLVYYGGRIRGEWLTVVVLLGFVALWTAVRDDRRVAAPLSAGVVLGLLALARPQLLPMAGLLPALTWLRQGARAALFRGALLLPGLLLLTSPWAVRNMAVLGTGPVLATNGGYNLWKSFNDQTDGSQTPVVDYSLWEGVEERDFDHIGRREAWRYVREHPVRSLLLAPAKIGHLLGPERDYLSDVKLLNVPRRSLAVDLAFALVQNAAWFLLLAGGLFALLGPARSAVKESAVALLLTLLGTHLVFFGDDRFHLPLVPLLAIVLPEAWDGSLRPARRVVFLVLLLLAEAGFWVGILLRDAGRVGALFG